jgi:RNA polymerase sigma-70 factor, ECF subfamily
MELQKNEASRACPPLDFHVLYRDELSYVWTTLKRLGAPAPDLEDLVHEVFITAHRRLGTYDAARPLRPWLFGIAYRTLADFRRLAHNQREVGVDDAPEQASLITPEEGLQSQQARDLVHQGLDSLDLDKRAVFVMHELEGHSVPEIAQTLDVPLNTLYSRLRFARQKFSASVRRIQLSRGEP